jgi:hypothetical protein
MYPYYSWYHQGLRKRNERGLDIIGDRVGTQGNDPGTIGVQVKLHDANNAPTEVEWLKFLAGCFARRISRALFVTSGRLTSEQRREADEAGVIIIEGQEEIGRLANLYNIAQFELFVTDRDQ